MDSEKVLVVTGGSATRGERLRELRVDSLSVNVHLFLEQMSTVLEKAPEKMGRFRLEEFEVHAEVTAQGTLAILGIGGEAGVAGGLKFVFRRGSAEK
jgi:hypothetical protein